MQATVMPYPTPGFVVRQTFLEFEPNSEVQEEVQEPRSFHRRERAHSDTDLLSKVKAPSKFGSEELRIYCELRWAERQTTESTEEPAPDSQFDVDESVAPTSAAASEPSVVTNTDSQSEDGLSNTPRDECTTVSLSNLPTDYSRVSLTETLDSEGFIGTYDFVFVPMDLRTRACNGTALINLHSNAEARRLIAHFGGFSAWGSHTPESRANCLNKTCEATWSRYTQGLAALLERYRNSPVMNDAVPDIYKPAVFGLCGKREDFPEPTKRVRMPRLRRKAALKHAQERDSAESADAVETLKADGIATWRNSGFYSGPSMAQRGCWSQKANIADTTSMPAARDAWFVDLVASRVNFQAAPCAAAAAPSPGGCGLKAYSSPYSSHLANPSSVPLWLGYFPPGQWS